MGARGVPLRDQMTAENLHAPLKGNVQVRSQRGQPMAQAVLRSDELTAPLSGVASNILTDLRAIMDVLDSLEPDATVRTLRPEPTPEGAGLTENLIAVSNEVATLRLMVETVANRIGQL